jgi:outer membrane receptor protein involved in Fe transport
MHYDLGLFHRFAGNFVTRLNFYYIDVDNYIVANSGDVYHSASSYGFNMNRIAYYGAELELDTTWFEKLTVFGNYTYRETSYDKEDLLADAVLLTLAPKHKANLGVRYRLFPNTLLTSDIRYMGKRESEGNVYTLDGFSTMDVSIDHELSENMTLRVYGSNIFGESYQEVYGYPMPEGTYGINLKVSFF